MSTEARTLVATLTLPFESVRTLYTGTSEVRLYRNEVTDVLQIGKRVSAVGAEKLVVFQEAKWLQSIRHNHIVPVHDVARVREPKVDRLLEIIEMIIPYYQRGSIFDALQRGNTFSVGEAVRLTRETLLGLGELHENYRLLHRDVKSANVFIDDAGTARIGDLGLAAEMDHADESEAFPNAQMYTAPEILSTKRSNRATDVYGVGLMLHELLNGAFPYESYSRESIATRLERGQRAIKDEHLSQRIDVPARLRTIVRKATAKNPAHRFQTARQMIDALDRAPFVDWDRVSETEWDGRLRMKPYTRYRVSAIQVLRPERWRLSGRRFVNTWQRCVADKDVADIRGREAQAFFDQLVALAARR